VWRVVDERIKAAETDTSLASTEAQPASTEAQSGQVQ
jgi:hypothetical protein